MKKPAISALVICITMALSAFSQGTHKTLVLRPGPSDGIDADIRTDMPSTPRGWSPDFIANAWTAQGNFFIQRSLLKFDLSQVPVTAIVQHASLFLYTNLNSGHYQLDSGANAACINRVIQPWQDDQVSWVNQPDYSTKDLVLLPQSTSNTQNYEVDVTGHVADMVSNPDENYGWIFRLETEERYRCMVFASSDNAIEEWRPMLILEYVECESPVAKFIYSIDSSEVQFSNLSSEAVSWNWTFGDSTSSNEQNPLHTYSATGRYEVCLTVGDSCGTNTFCDTINIACTPPMAGFEYAYTDTIVTFFDTSQSGGQLSWFWEFGDGTTSTDQNPVHHYDQFGIYKVCLTVIDSCSLDMACKAIALLVPLKTGFTSMASESNDLKIAFEDNSTGATSWLWDFGDGKSSDIQNPVHLYNHYGDYFVCLTAGNPSGQETACNPLSVKQFNINSKTGGIICYPNPYPGSGTFHFILPEDSEKAVITLTDISGRLIMKKEFRNLQRNVPVMMDVTGLCKGMYMLEGSYNAYSRMLKVEVY